MRRFLEGKQGNRKYHLGQIVFNQNDIIRDTVEFIFEMTRSNEIGDFDSIHDRFLTFSNNFQILAFDLAR